MNAVFEDGTAARRFHIPTRRVPLELVISHLVAEWGVTPRTDDWRTVLAASIEGFDQRRSAD